MFFCCEAARATETEKKKFRGENKFTTKSSFPIPNFLELAPEVALFS